jgi:hypothetical protein
MTNGSLHIAVVVLEQGLNPRFYVFLASGGRLARKGEDLRPNGLKTLKRKHGESLSHVNSNVVKNTQVLQPDRGCTIGNLFPEILSMIFEYCRF